MRVQEFFVRILFFLPLAFWVTFLFLMVLGIIAYLLGAHETFYCTVYCKVALALLIGGSLAVIICQVNACWKK